MNDIKNTMNVMFMGLPGSGKDTQAEFLQKILEERDGKGSVLYIYTGARLRKTEKSGTYTAGLITEKIMKKGAKAPDFLAIWVWAQSFVSELKKDNHIILSSSPRTLHEAKALDDAFAFYNREYVFPIYLNISLHEASERLSKVVDRGGSDDVRIDDVPETINKRLAWFETFVRPAIEYYRTESKNKLIEIDGNPHDPERIHQEIRRAIGL
ncbi:MAG: nucleoside monophosphate kinase [Candidatus Niyogibacteria bacterium]|nr:nucleoside monophosphate kinase [Candidatus Niyogibacteria bacterium]